MPAASRHRTSGSSSAPESGSATSPSRRHARRRSARSPRARRWSTPALPATDIDLIVCATSTPDFIFPGTACLIQKALGNPGGAAFDVQAVCSGFIYGLATADALIRCGTAQRALVIGAETFSRILDWNDRTTCVLFGDGAGAVVLGADSRPGVLASRLHADGRYENILRTPGQVCDGGSPATRS